MKKTLLLITLSFLSTIKGMEQKAPTIRAAQEAIVTLHDSLQEDSLKQLLRTPDGKSLLITLNALHNRVFGGSSDVQFVVRRSGENIEFVIARTTPHEQTSTSIIYEPKDLS